MGTKKTAITKSWYEHWIMQQFAWLQAQANAGGITDMPRVTIN